MDVARKQQRKTRRFLAGNPELEFLVVHLVAGPVFVIALEHDVEAGLPPAVHEGAGPGGPLVEAFDSLLVPLCLAGYAQVAGTLDGKHHGRGHDRILEAKHHRVLVDGLHFLGRDPHCAQRRRRILADQQRVGVHDVSGRHLPVAEVELHALAQVEGPLLEVGAVLPLRRQRRDGVPRLGVHSEQRLPEGFELEVVRTRDGPEAVALVESG